MDGLGFWLGRWICTWDGGHGTNTVTLDMDGHVVTERFEALEPEPFSGLSVSVQGTDGLWRQTWVDSTGSYWHFEGGPQDNGTFVRRLFSARRKTLRKALTLAGYAAEELIAAQNLNAQTRPETLAPETLYLGFNLTRKFF